uniref:Fibroblast growth factor receptor substrate 3 n=1 Tax=Cyprinodon variegatus TaxID=28743 RepID=A0A3Q2CLA0_CYPVA
MGSCWSCLYRDPIRDNHLTKFKVINVDDEGNELGSGIMELTQTELILHTRKRDAIRWPYLCLRRYGYDSNLFSFESGRRCQTGQIFAFKCSRAEEIFNLLQELMQCNSINVVEESMMISRSGHTPEMEMSRTPQTPNPGFPVQSFPNGYPGYPIRGDSSQPSLEDHGHSLMGLEDQTHTYVNTVSMDGDLSMRHCVHSLPEVRPSALPETTRGAMPVGGQGNPQSNLRCCPLEERKDPQVFLQPSSQEVKFMLGPTPAQRHLIERERLGHNPHNLQPAEGATGSETEGDEPTLHLCNSHSYHLFHHHMHRHPSHEHPDSSQSGELTYENINDLRSGRKQRLSPSSVSQSVGSSSSSSTGDSHSHSLLHSHGHGPSSLPPQGYACERSMGGGHRRTALLNYENLPSLPPVWEYSALQRDDEQEEDDEDQDEDEYEEEEDDFDEYEFSEGPGTPNGYHQDSRGIHRDALQNYVNTEQQPPRLRHPCPPQPRVCRPDSGGRIFSFDFRRRSRSGVGGCEHSHIPASRQLNYIQVDLEEDPSRQALGSGGAQPQHQRLPPKKCGPPVPRRSECYAVIDLKKTAAMSNLQKALPRDDGTSRKTRHNSTDLPL